MNKLKNWLRKTFTGVYGIDNLYFVLFGVAFFLIIINLFFRSWIIYIPLTAVFGFMIFRAMSHNYKARRRENDWFFGVVRKVKNFFKLQKNRFKDRKTHVYKKCPKCKAVLRLPKAKGKHTAVCPRCQNHFAVK